MRLWLGRPLALVGALSVLSGACATSGDVDRLDARVASLEHERDQLRDRIQQDVEKLERLHKMVTDAEDTLRKNGADLQVRLERLEQDHPKLRGTVEAVEFRMNQAERDLGVVKKEIADRLGSTIVFLPADLPKDKDGVWAAAESRANPTKLQEAKAIYELFAASFPDDPRAPQGLFKVGQLLEQTGDLEGAVKAHQTVYDRFPDAAEAPQAILRIAEIFILKGDCARAKSLLKFIQTNYRQKPEAATAKEREKSAGKDCKKPN